MKLPAARGLGERSREPRDIASLALLRILLGTLMFASTVRFLASGWVERFYERPDFFFSYWLVSESGADFVSVLPYEAMVVVHVVMAAAALCIAIGLFYRVATVVFFATFTYVELIDVTNYLNHYYLVSLLALLFCFLPLHGAWSIDAWRRPELRRGRIPAWMLWLVRIQIGVVYFYAGLAKLEPDWLLHAQPLGIWLAARAETPVIGPLLALPEAAYVMSWAGMLHDVLIVPLLLWPRSRRYAFAALLVFHFFTHVLFTIGVFPFLMPIAATVFFAPDWPRRLLRRLHPAAAKPEPARAKMRPLSRAGIAVLVAYCAFQVLMPLRTHLYGGSVLWHEQGMRWSWRVMLREKNGAITYRVRARGWDHERQVSPSRYLTNHQEREMSGQPDLILALAHHIAEEHRARGERDVEVRVDALVSLNGRPAAPMIDPDVDLARVDDSVAPADWITPMPDGPPLRVRGVDGSLLARWVAP